MIGVFVSLTFPETFDAPALRAIAQQARAKFEAMPGLRSKVFTLNQAQRQAVNFYIWDDEAAARAFFTSELTDRIAQLYGSTPTIAFVEIAELVENAH
jgi:heme-degrading monooxygenase HmoA